MANLIFLATFFTFISMSCKNRSNQKDAGQLAEATPIRPSIKIKTLVSQSNSIDSFLSKLPKQMRENFTLMHHSNSLHSDTTTFDSPRAILFDNDASTIVAFNGKSNFAEVIQFDSEVGSYTFTNIVEEKTNNRSSLKMDSDSSACAGCHTNALRPNWDPYFFWEGAYGSEDDSYTENGDELREVKKLIPKLGPKSTTPRYRHLLNVEKILGPTTLSNGISRLDSQSKLLMMASKPNMSLLLLLAQQNTTRVAKLLMNASNYKRDKFLIAATLAGCVVSFDSGENLLTESGRTMAQKDVRIQMLNKANPAVFESFGGPLEVVKGGNLGWLAYVDRQLGLGMKIDLDEMGMHQNGKALESAARGRGSESITAYFNDGSGDYTPMILLRGLAALDPDFNGLAAYACQDGPNQADLKGKKVKGYSYCSSDSSGRSIDAKTKVCGEILKRWR
jgi:hypothetical protein